MKKHIGSTIALGFGVLYGLSSLMVIIEKRSGGEGFLGGIITILGALAYRSAKKRKLGEIKSSSLRKSLEVFTIVIIVAAVLLQKNLPNNIVDNPIPNLIIPLWAIITYMVIALKNQKEKKWNLTNLSSGQIRPTLRYPQMNLLANFIGRQAKPIEDYISFDTGVVNSL